MPCRVLHRWSFLWLFTALLYGGLLSGASAAETADSPEPETRLAPEPHIALLLPLGSGAFVRHAQAVRDGFVAAAKAQGSTPLPLRIYVTSDEPQQILEGYREALRGAARLVVGPITRNGVSALASTQAVTVPTLALNVPETGATVPSLLYMLSLQVEAEARVVARVAYDDGRRTACTVVGNDPLSQRMHEAFVTEFTRL
ncbi:MAG TPA: penicillin-binding protein activator, partial [Burkholderiales bacterium]|nr:penicillin-binding protein activator [Burkholderiales bacterium]